MSYPSEELSADLLAQRNKVHATWAALTDPPFLTWNPDTKHLTGRIEDYDVQVSLVSQMPHGQPNDSSGWKTLIQVTDSERLHGLATVRESTNETLRKWLGMDDIQLKEPALDKRYRITGAAPSLVHAVLTAPEVKEQLQSREGLPLRDGSVIHTTPGPATDDLLLRIQAAVALADALRQSLRRVVERLAKRANLKPTPDWYRNLPVFSGTVEGASVVMVRSPEGDGLYILASHCEAVLQHWKPRLQACELGARPVGYHYVKLSTVDPTKVGHTMARMREDLRAEAVRMEVQGRKDRIAHAHWLERTRREWHRITIDLALEVSRDPEHNGPRFDGTVRGVPVSARPHSRDHKRYDLTVPIDPPLSARFAIHSRRRAPHDNPIRLGDPILDGMICVSPHRFGNDTLELREVADIARAALCRDAVRGDLLSLMETFPRTYICGEEIYVPVEKVSPKRLARAIRDAVAVAHALSQPEPQERTP